MSDDSPQSMQPSSDTTNVLPLLNENKGSLSLHLTIDKSVSKVAAWFVMVIIGNSILLGAGVVLAVWMTISYLNEERQNRMVEYYQHELDAKFIASGFIKPEEDFSHFKQKYQREQLK